MLTKSFHGLFQRRKRKMRLPLCSHFPSLIVIEKDGSSPLHSGISIFRDALNIIHPEFTMNRARSETHPGIPSLHEIPCESKAPRGHLTIR